jgi:hypothetical protein
MPRHPSVEQLLQFFQPAKEPEDFYAIACEYERLALAVADGPQNAQTTVSLNKLLESRDCAKRARFGQFYVEQSPSAFQGIPKPRMQVVNSESTEIPVSVPPPVPALPIVDCPA